MKKILIALMVMLISSAAYGQATSKLPAASQANTTDLVASSQVTPGTPTGFTTRAVTMQQILNVLGASQGGLTATKNVRASGGAADCTLVFVNGFLTAGGTC